MMSYDINSHVGPPITTIPLHGTGTPVIDMRDFPYLQEAAQLESDASIEEESYADNQLDYTDLIKEEAFIGTVPYQTIVDCIKEQFDDYIGTEDHTNYVEVFYHQLKESYNVIDDEEDHPQERRDALRQIVDDFVCVMGSLFESHLAITISMLEGEDYDYDELEYIITALYTYFIINARDNFRTVIVKDITNKMKFIPDDDISYYDKINSMMRYYSPLVIAMGPMEFLRLTNNEDIVKLYDDGKISGVFLKRYSPRFFQYEDFEADVIAEIVMKQEVRDEIKANLTKKEV